MKLQTGSTDFIQVFASTWVAFETAYARSEDKIVKCLNIGGSVMQMRFAGTALVPQLLPALAHLVSSPQAQADVDIGIWDSVSTSIPMTPPPWSEADYLARGEIRGSDLNTAVQVAYHLGSGVLSMLHTERKTAVVWLHDAATVPYYEQAAPLRTLFHWWCAKQGQQLVHGAAVGFEYGAVLLTGKGGSGKSTTAIASLLAGLGYLGDDYVLCDLSTHGATVYSLFNSAKIDTHALTLFPQLVAQVANKDRATEEKSVVYVNNFYPERLLRSAPLRAILIPQVTANINSYIQPIQAKAAFLALAPTTVFQLPGAREASVAFLRRLVMHLPCYQLQLGRDIAQIPQLIQTLLTELT